MEKQLVRGTPRGTASLQPIVMALPHLPIASRVYPTQHFSLWCRLCFSRWGLFLGGGSVLLGAQGRGLG